MYAIGNIGGPIDRYGVPPIAVDMYVMGKQIPISFGRGYECLLSVLKYSKFPRYICYVGYSCHGIQNGPYTNMNDDGVEYVLYSTEFGDCIS